LAQSYRVHRALHSFPTRRSSDLMIRFNIVASSLCVVTRERNLRLAETTVASRVPYVPTCGSRLGYIGRHESGVSSTAGGVWPRRSEEHTSELQSRGHLVCRLLLE